MSKPLRILLVEDSERDAALLTLYLRRGGYEPAIDRVESEAQMTAKLDSPRWDAVICDYNLPGFSALAALAVLQKSGQKLPFLILSGEIAEKRIAEAMAAGANEWVFKYEMKNIVPALERTMQPGSDGV